MPQDRTGPSFQRIEEPDRVRRRQGSDTRRNPMIVPNDDDTVNGNNGQFPAQRPISYHNERTQHRHILKSRDRCRSEENMNMVRNQQSVRPRLSDQYANPARNEPVYQQSDPINPVYKSMDMLLEDQTTPNVRVNRRPASQEIIREPLSNSTEELVNRLGNQYRPRRSENRDTLTAKTIAERKVALGMTQLQERDTQRDSPSSRSPASPTFTSGSRSSILNSILESENQESDTTFRPIDASKSSNQIHRNESRISNASSTASRISRSDSSSVGHNPDFPLPPTQTELFAANVSPVTVPEEEIDLPEIPEDIQKTFDQIKRSSDSPPDEETPAPPPEPDTGLLPNSYFQPEFVARLNLETTATSSDKEGSENSDSEPVSEIILKQERHVLQLTEIKEDLIDEYRKNEIIGEQINSIIKNSCPKTVVSKYHLFVEDIESNFNLHSKLSGRILRVEASMNEDHDNATREALNQKFAALKGQKADADRCRAHCDAREKAVTESLQELLSEEDFSRFICYVNEKRHTLEEQGEIGKRIRMGEAQLLQLKDSLLK